FAGCSSAPATNDDTNGYPYPSQSLVDLFKGSLDSPRPTQTAAVPHPPNTYTPVDQPYTAAPGQPDPVAPSGSATATAAAASAPSGPPTNSDPAASAYPYPQQSLFDLFKKPDAQ